MAALGPTRLRLGRKDRGDVKARPSAGAGGGSGVNGAPAQYLPFWLAVQVLDTEG